VFFGNQVISKDVWPTRPPDLTLPEFFLWGLLKGKVYTNKPHTISDLQQNVCHEIAAISAQTLQHVFASLEHHVQLCMDARGHHF